MTISLNNNWLHAELNASNGALVSFYNKSTGWSPITNPNYIRSLELILKDGSHIITTMGIEQTPSSIKKISEEEAEISFDKIIYSEGILDISITINIKFDEHIMKISYHVENNSDFLIDELRYPSFSGIKPSGGDEVNALILGMNGNWNVHSMHKNFERWSCFAKKDHPGFDTSFPDPSFLMPMELIQAGNSGLYIGMHSKNDYFEAFQIHHELCGGWTDTLERNADFSDDKSNIVVTIACKHVFNPGTVTDVGDYIFCIYSGDWHTGILPYTDWRKTWYDPKPVPSWISDTDCWMTLHINSSAGCYRYYYRDLPKIMKDAAAHGVRCLQLIGWAIGGQDGIEPYQEIDPLLGTKEELKNAIAEIRAMGIRVLLMCKFRWVDSSSPNFTEMEPHIAVDLFGNKLRHPGYSYQTSAQHLGITEHGGYHMCHSSKKYRELCMREFKKLLELEPDGIMYDEFVYITACYSHDHGHRVGECCWNGGNDMAMEFKNYTDKINMPFIYAGEGVSDYMSQYYPYSYIRSSNGEFDQNSFEPVLRYINRDIRFATCLTGFDDREMVNQCLLYNFVINYEPFNFKGWVRDIEKTAAYGEKVNKLRRSFREYLIDGIFTDTIGAEFKTDDSLAHRYSVFKNDKGQKAIVVVNEDISQTLTGKISCPDAEKFDCYTPEDGFIVKSRGEISVPPRSAVVLIADYSEKEI